MRDSFSAERARQLTSIVSVRAQAHLERLASSEAGKPIDLAVELTRLTRDVALEPDGRAEAVRTAITTMPCSTA